MSIESMTNFNKNTQRCQDEETGIVQFKSKKAASVPITALIRKFEQSVERGNLSKNSNSSYVYKNGQIEIQEEITNNPFDESVVSKIKFVNSTQSVQGALEN